MFMIGEFSKISRVSKRLLHYYNDIGLFHPAHIDEVTGYRYYSAKQLPRLNRILVLKDLGLTLEQIMKMLRSEVSDDEIHGMLLIKKAEMEQTVYEDMQRLRRIEARLEQNQQADSAPDIVIKSIPPQPFLSVRRLFSTEEEVLQLVEQIRQTVPESVGVGVLGSFAGIVYTEDFAQINNDIDFGYFLKRPVNRTITLADDCVLRMHELPAVETMATSVQVGGPNLIFVTLGKIAQWIELNGYRIAGPLREIGFDLSTFSNMEEMVVEIQLPVEKALLE